MRPFVVSAACILLVHAARSPDLVIFPGIAQDPFPPARLIVVAADITLVETSVMEGWHEEPIVVTAEEVRTDAFLWRRMFYRCWDRLPPTLRDEGLAAMRRRYGFSLRGPERWDEMGPDDWDRVPQPMRGLAILGMIDCWERRYRPGERFGLPRRDIVDRLMAIAMAESWFQHRARSENPDGTSDIGIGQASASTRSRIRVLYVRGVADFGLADGDYLDPWKATRALVYWFSLLLQETGGDLDAATRAYNVGAASAEAGVGAAYLEMVRRRESDFVRCRSAGPSWLWLRAHSTSPCRADEPAAECSTGSHPRP